MNLSLLMLLSFILGGGGSDLLDYVSTTSYWQRDATPITVVAMQQALTPPSAEHAASLVSNLASNDPQVREEAGLAIIRLGPVALPKLEAAVKGANAQAVELAKLLVPRVQAQSSIQAVRRLMAIRTLGELKDKAALGTLSALQQSRAPFEADYAATAKALIQGKTLPHPRDPHARDDVWLLPSSFRAVAQIVPRGQGPVDYERAATQLHLSSDQNPAKVVVTFNTIALSAAEQLGNARLDALSIGLSEDFRPGRGYAVAIFSGQFDAELVLKLALASHVPFRTISGIDVFEPDSETYVFVPAPNRIVLTSSPAGQRFIPVVQLIRSMLNSEPTLKASPVMTALVGQNVEDSPLWAAVLRMPGYRIHEVLHPIDTLRLTTLEQNGALELTLNSHLAFGQDPIAAAGAIDASAKSAKEAVLQLEQQIPAMSELSALFRTCHSTFSDQGIVTHARLNESTDALFMLPLLIKSGSGDSSEGPTPLNVNAATPPTSQPADR